MGLIGYEYFQDIDLENVWWAKAETMQGSLL